MSLDTGFPRIAGDVGNPESYPFDVIVSVVKGADPSAIVIDGMPDALLLQRFETAAIELERQNVGAIISTCGFLITAQARIARAVRVPTMLSALSLFADLRATISGRIGILTASKNALGATALTAAGIDQAEVVIEGMEADPISAIFPSVPLWAIPSKPPSCIRHGGGHYCFRSRSHQCCRH